MEPNIQNTSTPNVPGGWWARYWASFFDGIVIGVPVALVALVLILLGVVKDVDQLEDSFGFGIIALIIYFAYYIYFTTKRGSTLGKEAFGLRVIDVKTNKNISYKSGAIREFFRMGVVFVPVLGVIYYFINGLTIVFSKNKRGIHDRVAGTQVVKVGPGPSKLIKFAVILLTIPMILVIIAGIFLLYLWFRVTF